MFCHCPHFCFLNYFIAVQAKAQSNNILHIRSEQCNLRFKVKRHFCCNYFGKINEKKICK